MKRITLIKRLNKLKGNDSPKGGLTGNYIKITTKII